jgi:soluble lytic murein transglycosylase-like protein
LERLHFGARARRRARLKRLALWASVLSLIALGLGIPGTDWGLRLLESIDGPASTVTSSASIQADRAPRSTLRVRRSADELRTRPDRSPSPGAGTPPAPAPPDSITEIVYDAAARHGLSGEYLLSVAQCESSLNPGAYNPAGYHGLFQFDYQTWGEFGSGDIYDPAAQAEAAAALIAAGESSRWPNCA